MGCSNQKSISVNTRSHSFQNGKLVQMSDGNYYLQKSRGHDKLIPQVHKGFEDMHKKMLKNIEDNNPEVLKKIRKNS